MRRRGRKEERMSGFKRMRRWEERMERIRIGEVALFDAGSGNSGRFRLVDYLRSSQISSCESNIIIPFKSVHLEIETLSPPFHSHL